MKSASFNYLPMALPNGKAPVRYAVREESAVVDLRSLVEAMGLAWQRWADAVAAQAGADQWPVETARDVAGRDTRLLAAEQVPNFLGWVAHVAPRMYPRGGLPLRRIEAARRDWADAWFKMAPASPFTGFVKGLNGLDGALPYPGAADAAWAGRRGLPITRDTEARVKAMIAAGRGKLEIADALGISQASVSLLGSGKYCFSKAAGQLDRQSMGWHHADYGVGTCATCQHAGAKSAKPWITVCARGGFVVARWSETCRLHQPVESRP